MGNTELKSLLIEIEDDVKYGKIGSVEDRFEQARQVYLESEEKLKEILNGW